jgi:hypothetical protein
MQAPGKVLVGFTADPHPSIDWGQPELMLRRASEVMLAKPDALVCGPGLGVQAESRRSSRRRSLARCRSFSMRMRST